MHAQYEHSPPSSSASTTAIDRPALDATAGDVLPGRAAADHDHVELLHLARQPCLQSPRPSLRCTTAKRREMYAMTTVLGIDIGGTGIKGAPVDTRSGQLLADRHRILTPHPATPDAVTGVVAELAKFFDWTGPTGATFPAVVKDGVARTAANVDPAWIGTDAATLFSEAIGGEVTVVNDADAAGRRRDDVRRGQGPPPAS